MSFTNEITLLQKGDAIAFTELFNEYHEKVYFYILQKTQSAYLAEEVTQLTFLKLWNYRNKLDESLSVSCQIFRIAKTTCIDLLRKENSKTKLSIIWKKQNSFLSNEVLAKVEEKQMEHRLANEIKKLPPMRRKVFEMSRYESKSYKEIAQTLLLSEKTVENHISLAIKQLRRLLLIF